MRFLAVSRRVFFGTLLLVSAAVQAAYPDKPIKIIVPAFPGSPPDALSRVIGNGLAKQLGQAVVVENKGGAGGNIGTQALTHAPADGYTLAYANNQTMATNEFLFNKLPYDPQTLTPVIGLASTSAMLLVGNDVPVKTVQELITYVKTTKQPVQYGSGGTGSSSHLGAELFKTKEGLQAATHIPYKGAAPAMTDLIAGNIHYLFDNIVTSAPQVQSGKVRALAVTSAERSPLFPQLPTMQEAGVKGFVMNAWGGIVTPPGTPRDVVMKLNTALNAVLKDPVVVDQLERMAFKPLGGTPEDFRKLTDSERVIWGAVVKQSGARVE